MVSCVSTTGERETRLNDQFPNRALFQKMQTTLLDTGIKNVPRLKKRSYEEILFTTMVLQAHGQNKLSNFVEALRLGDVMGDVDAVFLKLNIIMEWDNGYFHKEDRRDQDIRKTKRLLEENANMIVVRIRYKAVPLMFSHDRCIIINVNSGTLEDALDVFSSTLATCELRKSFVNRHHAKMTVHSLYELCDSEFRRNFKDHH